MVLEWDDESLNPELTTASVRTKIRWKCNKAGHHWIATIVSRKYGTGCPLCSSGSTSNIENNFRTEFSKYFSEINVDHTTKIILGPAQRKIQVDIIGIYKNQKIIVEYDGSRWHSFSKNINRDILNTKLFLDQGYCVIRIREDDLPYVNIKDKMLIQSNFKWTSNKTKIANYVKELIDILEKIL